MADKLSISRQEPAKPDMNYRLLRQEGIKHIRQLASRIWTDHNTHDPGITMLEMLCYAITDLGYRCNFSIEDILASDPGNRIGNSPDFFEAHQVLPDHPFTVSDFRKIIIDRPGVRNAWIQLAGEAEQKIFFDQMNNVLTYTPNTEPVNIRGLCKVAIELSEDKELGDLNSNIISGEMTIPEGDAEIVIPYDISFPYYDETKPGWRKLVSIDKITVVIAGSDISPYHFIAHADVKHLVSGISDHFDLRIRINATAEIINKYKTQVRQKLGVIIKDAGASGVFSLFSKKTVFTCQHLAEVHEFLGKCRNLCEDFLSVDLIRIQEIAVNGEIELPLDVNTEELLADLYFKIHSFIDPPVKFYTLDEMLGMGFSPEEIFDGPLLEHGFIRDENLEAFRERDAIFTSDIINLIIDPENQQVIAVKGLRLSNFINNMGISPDAKNCLKLFQPEKYKPKLSIDKSLIVCKKRGIPIPVDPLRVSQLYNEKVTDSEPDKSIIPDFHLNLPVGRDRLTGSYRSVQEDFPLTYGIGEAGLPDSSTDERIVQARQLKGYLLFFDQVLADFLSQLSNVKNLFSIDPLISKTYFEQAVYQVPGAMYLLKEFSGDQPSMEDKTALNTAWELFRNDPSNDYVTAVRGMMEDDQLFSDRRNRFLDHLLARFCEEFTDYTLLMLADNNQVIPSELLAEKVNFLQEFPVISGQRVKALSLIDDPAEMWDTMNIPGLQRRVGRLLGFADCSRRFLTHGDYSFIEFYQEKDTDAIDEYRFRIRDENEKILLSSTKAYKILEDGYQVVLQVLDAGKDETNYMVQPSSDGQFYFNLLNDQSKIIARRIDLFLTQLEAETEYKAAASFLATHFEGVNDEPEEGFHVLEHLLLRPRFKEVIDGVNVTDPLLFVEPDDFGNIQQENKDPYSFRLTVVFPLQLKQFNDPSFRELAERIVRLETPAHVMPDVVFLNNIQLSKFEYAYKNWLELFVKPIPEDKTARQQHLSHLAERLEKLIGSMEFIPLPPLVS